MVSWLVSFKALIVCRSLVICRMILCFLYAVHDGVIITLKSFVMEYKIFQVQNGVYKNYCYLVHDQGMAVLIDPAWEYSKIDEYIVSQRLKLCGVLVTHHHSDHVDLAEEFSRRYDCRVYISEFEAERHCEKFSNGFLLVDEQDIFFGSIKVSPVFTPGHTPGSTCYLIGGEYLFTGDTLFNEGCGVCVFEGGSESDMFFSMQKLKALISDNVLVFPGHRIRTSIGRTFLELKRELNLFLMIEDEVKFIKFRKQTSKNILNFS